MIYFVRAGEFIKIGYSNSPWSRFDNLQTANPDLLEMIAISPGDYAMESELFSVFSEYHYRGEWFHNGSRIQEYCRACWSIFPNIQNRPEYTINLHSEDLRESDFEIVRAARMRGDLDSISTNSLHAIGVSRFNNMPNTPASKMIDYLCAEGLIERAGERQPYNWTPEGRGAFPSPTD